MRRMMLVVCVLVFLSAVLVMPAASATTWDVYEGDSIQDAINGTSDGDTVFVHAGTYLLQPTGHDIRLYVNKPNITLKGEGADVVTIDGNGGGYLAIGVAGYAGGAVDASGSVFEGFTVINCSSGVAVLENSPNCIIRNNIISASQTGFLTLAPNTIIKGNTISNFTSSRGIRLDASNCTFTDNVVLNAVVTYGAVDIPTNGSTIVNNTIINSTGAAIFVYSKKPSATGIITKNNVISNGKGIWFYNAAQDNKIYLNNFVNNSISVVYKVAPATTYWNSTEPLEYVYGGTTYTNYLGNYWKPQYTGTDADEDGLGDTAYDIPGSATDKDYRPLMMGYESYPAPAEVPADWNLTLNGELTDVINRTSFEEGAACHNASWTDGSSRTWTGIPLWRLVGWVDDTDQHDFNDTLADAGYEITVIAGDGYSKTFDSSFVKRNDDIILANELDGAPIPEDSTSYPLRLTGSALTSGQNVKGVVEILLTFPVPWEGYLVPQDSAGSYGEDNPVELWVDYNATGLPYGAVAYQIDFHFDPSCVNVTSANFSTSPFGSHIFNPYAPGVVRILEDNYLTMVPISSGTYKMATLTLHGESLAGSTSDLGFDPVWCVVSDTDGNPIENRYTNGTYACAAPQPDLVITAKSEDWVNFAEKTYNVTYTVKNVGAAEAGASTTSIKIDDVEVATDPVPGLAVDASYTSTVSPFTMSGDGNTINVCADKDDAVEESDETNNCLENEWTALLKVDIDDYTLAPGSTVKAPITVYGIQNYGTGTISVAFDKAVAQVTTVESSSDSTVTSSNIDNPAGIVTISAWNVTGVSGDIVFAYVTFKAVGALGSSTALDLTVSSLRDISYNNLPAYTDNGSLAITENAPPIVSNPTATPDTILNDNGRARVPDTNVSQLSVHVTDTTGVSSVTVNLTPILGPGNDGVPLTLIAGDSKSGTWAVDVTATYDAGVDQTQCLAVNATDVFGNSNTAKCIPLTVLRRGDVVRDNVVDMGDALYIARYTVGLELAPDEFVAGVVPASSWDGVDMGDALYIARYTVGTEVAP